jgi:hypothetical protein
LVYPCLKIVPKGQRYDGTSHGGVSLNGLTQALPSEAGLLSDGGANIRQQQLGHFQVHREGSIQLRVPISARVATKNFAGIARAIHNEKDIEDSSSNGCRLLLDIDPGLVYNTANHPNDLVDGVSESMVSAHFFSMTFN